MMTDAAPTYAFLSQPPPLKRRNAHALPQTLPPQCQLPAPPTKPTRRPSFTAKITAWAAQIQPGSPALPSPHRLTGGIAHSKVPSSPLIHATPTPGATATHTTFDLAALGYNTLFVHMPKTPETPSPLLRAKAQKEMEAYNEKRREKAAAKEESKEKRGRMIKKIRSLTTLRPRTKSTSKPAPAPTTPGTALASPTYTTATAPMPAKASSSNPKPKAKKPKSKKAVYAPLTRAPPTLANELALMQFADGGRMDDHIKRALTTDAGVGDVYRDGNGGVWWDREEELEYQALLLHPDGTSASPSAASWVKFSPTSPLNVAKATLSKTKGAARESTLSSVPSTVDSDLDPAYLIQAEDAPFYPDERVLNFDPTPAVPEPKTPQEASAARANRMLLNLPARPFRAARHLRKAEFMVDMQAFGLVMANCAAAAAASTSTTTTTSSSSSSEGESSSSSSSAKKSFKRRRPAPLKISPGMTKMRRVVAVSSPGSGGVPPLSATLMMMNVNVNLAALPSSPLPQPPSKRAGVQRRAVSSPVASLPVPVSVAVPVPVPTVVVDEVQLVRGELAKEGKRDFLEDTFRPEPVSCFDSDSDSDDDEDFEPRQTKASLKEGTPFGLGGLKKRASRLDMRLGGMFGGGAKA